jgi:hypothetical protein
MPFESHARVMQEHGRLFAWDPGRLNTQPDIPPATATLEQLHTELTGRGYTFERSGTDDDKLIGFEEATVLEIWVRRKSPRPLSGANLKPEVAL